MPPLWVNRRKMAASYKGGALPTIAFVQAANQGTWGSAGGGFTTTPFGSNIGVGHAVVACLGSNSNNTDTFTAVTGGGIPLTGANAFAALDSQGFAAMWAGFASTGGSSSVLVTDTSSQWDGWALEFSGLTGAVVSTASGGASVSITPTRAGQLVVAFVAANNYASGSGNYPASPWVVHDYNSCSVAYQVVSAPGLVTAAWTVPTGAAETIAAVFN